MGFSARGWRYLPCGLYPVEAYTDLVVLIVGVPVAFGGAIVLLFWIVSGFKMSN